MKRLFLFTLAGILLILWVAPDVTRAATTDVPTVRLMLTAPDNRDFSIFDQTILPDVLIEIIQNDPTDALYHDRVVLGALVALASLQVPEAVDVLIDNLDEHTTTCVYWLGQYSTSEAIEAITEYLDNEDSSVRYEAAEALGYPPLFDDEVDQGYLDTLSMALAKIQERIPAEEDPSITVALTAAEERLTGLIEQAEHTIVEQDPAQD